MAFENVDLISLSSGLQLCKEKLKSYNKSSIESILSNSNAWNCEAKKKFNTAFKELYDIDYKKLETKISDYIKVVEQMKKYVQFQNEINEAKIEYKNLEATINPTLPPSEILSISTKMRQTKSKIDNYETEMTLLLSTIESNIKA